MIEKDAAQALHQRADGLAVDDDLRPGLVDRLRGLARLAAPMEGQAREISSLRSRVGVLLAEASRRDDHG